MTKVPMGRVLAYYRSHRRENFAASQRLEGIFTAATTAAKTTPLPSKEALRKKYSAMRG